MPSRFMAVPALALTLAAFSGTAHSQASPASTHLAHVTTEFSGAPDSRGLAVTAAREINEVMRHANLAALAPGGLPAMRTHAQHILHVIDPAEVTEGPGLGFGVKPAIDGVVRHIGLAANAPGASESLVTHARHIAQASDAVIRRADEIASTARQLVAAESAAAAGPLAERIRVLALQLDTGSDSDGNGRIDLDGEAGMTHVEDHIYLVLEAERLPRVLR